MRVVSMQETSPSPHTDGEDVAIKPPKTNTKRHRSPTTTNDDDWYEDKSLTRPSLPKTSRACRINNEDEDEDEDDGLAMRRALRRNTRAHKKAPPQHNNSPPGKRSRLNETATTNKPETAGNGIYDPPKKPTFDGTETLKEPWPWVQEPCPAMKIGDLTKPFPGPLHKGLRQRALFHTSTWVDSEEEDEESREDSWLDISEEEDRQHDAEVFSQPNLMRAPQHQTRQYRARTKYFTPPATTMRDSPVAPSPPPVPKQKYDGKESKEKTAKRNPILEEITVRQKPNTHKRGTATRRRDNLQPKEPTVPIFRHVVPKDYPAIQSPRRHGSSSRITGIDSERRQVSSVSGSSTSASSASGSSIEPSKWLVELTSHLQNWQDSNALEWLSNKDNQFPRKQLRSFPGKDIAHLVPLVKQMAGQLLLQKKAGQSPETEFHSGIKYLSKLIVAWNVE